MPFLIGQIAVPCPLQKRKTIAIRSETTPGVFRSSGTIGVNLQPWTQDTYIMTGGVWTGFFADGGTYQISGGTIRNGTFNYGNLGADLTVELSAAFR